MATAKTNGAEALETFATAGNKAFKDNFDKAMSAFGDFNSFGKENVEALVESFTKAGKSVEALNAEVMAYTKTQLEGGAAAAKKLAGARSLQELIELQTEYAKSSMDSYMGEVNKLTDLYSGAVKDAIKPINERVSAAVELMQASR